MPSIARGRTSDGRDHLGEAGVAGLLHREVDQRELELGADAGEEVEARARHLGAALDVDGAEDPAELDVVARLEALGGEVARRADRLEHDVVVLAAGRRLVGGEVGDRQQRGLPGLLGLGLRGLGGLHLGGERLGARQQRLLLLALGLRDLLAERLLLAALGLEVGDRLRGAPRRPPAPRRRRRRTARAWPGRRARGRGRHGGCAGRSRVKASGRRPARLTRDCTGRAAVDVRRCLLRGPTPSYFCPCSTAPASCSWAGPLLSFAAVRAGAARGRPGLGSGRRSSTTVVRRPREYAVGLGWLVEPLRVVEVAFGTVGHDGHDRCRRGR